MRRLAAARGGPAHLLISHRGEVVVDDRFGVGADAAFWPFSVSKVFVATLVWSLIAEGAIDPDAPVAEYWPEFATAASDAAAKRRITVMDVLKHRSGLPRPGGPVAELMALANYSRSLEQIAAANPIRSPEDPPAYEWLAWGFILGEVARRASGDASMPGDGRGVAQLLERRILEPIGARGTFLGLPATERWRAVPLRGTDPATAAVAAVINQPAVRRAVIPAGGVSTSVHDALALIDELRRGGERLGLAAEHVVKMVSPSNAGEYDPYAGSRTWWGHGVQLGHPGRRAANCSAFGRLTSARAWGHNGSNVATAWHDPEHDLTFIYFSGIVEMFPINRLRFLRMQDAAIDAARSAKVQ